MVFKNSVDINKEIMTEMINEADVSGNQEITYNEFKNLMLCIQKSSIGENQ